MLIIYRYDSTTGIFTVPPGGDGYYYFSVYFRVDGDISAAFEIEVNGELLCTAYSDLSESPNSDSQVMSCGGTAYTVEGIYIKKILIIIIIIISILDFFFNFHL